MATIQLPPDFKEFLKLLNSNKVEYLVVGGYAVNYYGYPRATADTRHLDCDSSGQCPPFDGCSPAVWLRPVGSHSLPRTTEGNTDGRSTGASGDSHLDLRRGIR